MTNKLNKWGPTREEFLTPVSSLIDQFFNESMPAFGTEFGVEFFGNNSYPKVDVKDHLDSITIEAEIPGLTRDCLLYTSPSPRDRG